MNLWDFLHANPWWGLVYLVVGSLGLSAALSTVGSGFRRKLDDQEDDS